MKTLWKIIEEWFFWMPERPDWNLPFKEFAKAELVYCGRILWHFLKVQFALLAFFFLVLVVGLALERIFR